MCLPRRDNVQAACFNYIVSMRFSCAVGKLACARVVRERAVDAMRLTSAVQLQDYRKLLANYLTMGKIN